MGKERQQEDDRVDWHSQAIKRRAFRGGERLGALYTEPPLSRTRMDADIALADLSSGGARQIGAAYRRGIHDRSPLLAWLGSIPRRSMAGPSFSLQGIPHHGNVGCTNAEGVRESSGGVRHFRKRL